MSQKKVTHFFFDITSLSVLVIFLQFLNHFLDTKFLLEPAVVSWRRYLQYVSGTLSAAWQSGQNSHQDLSPVSLEVISQVVWKLMSVHATALLYRVMCYVTVNCNKLYCAEIIPEQNTSKIVEKNILDRWRSYVENKIDSFFLEHGVYCMIISWPATCVRIPTVEFIVFIKDLLADRIITIQ